MPNAAYQEVINGKKKTLDVATVSASSREGTETIQTFDAACDLLRFSRVSMSSLPFNASSRQLIVPKSGETMPHRRMGSDLLDDVVQWGAHCHALQQSRKMPNRISHPPSWPAFARRIFVNLFVCNFSRSRPRQASMNYDRSSTV